MNVISKTLFFILFIVFSNHLFAQTELNFIVVDTLKCPISYPEVGARNNNGCIGSKQGLINLTLKDSLSDISAGRVGYETITIPISEAKTKDTIELIPLQRLPELKIAKHMTSGKIFGNKKHFNLDIPLYYPRRISTIIPNKKFKKHFIQEIHFYVLQKSSNNPKLRIKIYSIDDNGFESNELLNTQDILIEEIKQGWNSIVLKEKVRLPIDGVIITLQSLPSDRKTSIRLGGNGWKNIKKLNLTSSGNYPFSETKYKPHLQYTHKGFSLAIYLNVKKYNDFIIN